MPLLSDGKEIAHGQLAEEALPRSEDRVLFALSGRERTQFFPSLDDSSLTYVPNVWTSSEYSPPHYRGWTKHLKEARPTILVSCWTTPPISPKLLFSDELPLRYICHTAGSVKKIVPREFILRGGVVTNWGTMISCAVAEHALLLMLASLRNLPEWCPAFDQTRHIWGNASSLGTRTLRGKKVGIHGFGNIARELIRLLEPFGVECMAYSHQIPASYVQERGVTPCRDLKDLFRKCDIVVECEALTLQTTGIITEELLLMMPEDALFVNVARGALVDEPALARLAAMGRIRVASDVFYAEPLPDDSPLRNLKNVIISPHIAGPTSECYARCGDFALRNIEYYLKRQPLQGRIDLEIYDRST